MTWLLLMLSGLGVAMFHPAAGAGARIAAGESASAMSLFATGGSVGFFLAPLLVAPVLSRWGIGATVVFIAPALPAGLMLLRLERRAAVPGKSRVRTTGTDRWAAFGVLTGVEVLRSVLFFGVNTFIGLYWIEQLHSGRLLAGVALAAYLIGSVAGTLLGGRLADRLGAVRVIQLGSALALPCLIALRLAPAAYPALTFAVLAGVATNIPFAVLIKLGQDYLPGRPGTASGVTLGLAVSVGGLSAPLFGAIAQHAGTAAVFTALCVVPVLATGVSFLLPQPSGRIPV
jgi:FSR family fosmidomycin resistance protein-like MFS transporter